VRHSQSFSNLKLLQQFSTGCYWSFPSFITCRAFLAPLAQKGASVSDGKSKIMLGVAVTLEGFLPSRGCHAPSLLDQQGIDEA